MAVRGRAVHINRLLLTYNSVAVFMHTLLTYVIPNHLLSTCLSLEETPESFARSHAVCLRCANTINIIYKQTEG